VTSSRVKTSARSNEVPFSARSGIGGALDQRSSHFGKGVFPFSRSRSIERPEPALRAKCSWLAIKQEAENDRFGWGEPITKMT